MVWIEVGGGFSWDRHVSDMTSDFLTSLGSCAGSCGL